MNILKRCCFRSLRENKKRTTVTVIGVILASALITGVACLAVSFRASMIAYEAGVNGNFHYYFSGVSQKNLKYFQNNQNIADLCITEEIGYALLEGSGNPEKPYLYIRAMDRDGQDALALQLTDGRMPENDKELVISRHIQYNGLVDIGLGDVLTLQTGDRVSEGRRLNQMDPYSYEAETLEAGVQRTYTVVGIIERPNETVEGRMAPGYSVFTVPGKGGMTGEADIYASYTDWGIRHEDQVTAGILGVSMDLYKRYYGTGGSWTLEEEKQITSVARQVGRNQWLLKWEGFNISSGTLQMIYGLAGLALLVIILTAAVCIRNSFVISLTEKMKLYGRLASVGTTSKQQRRIIYYEAMFLGMTGIPLGVCGGVGATWILVQLVGGMVEDGIGIRLIFGVSIPAVCLAGLLSIIMIFFSALKPARQAARLSPISAIRANQTINSKRKRQCPRIILRLFGIGGKIAWQNLKCARVKYRTTVVSIMVSAAVFIGMSTFVQLLSISSKLYYEDVQYQLRISIEDDDSYEKAERIAGLEGVQKADILRTGILKVDKSQIPFTNDYLELFSPSEEVRVIVNALGEKGYADYCRQLGISVEEAQGQAIVLADYEEAIQQENKTYLYSGKIAFLREGTVLSATDTDTQIRLLTQTSVRPMCLSHVNLYEIRLIVSDQWMDSHELSGKYDNVDVYLQCGDPGAMEAAVRGMGLNQYFLQNLMSQYQSERSLHLVIAIFLYGFIIVVALIGITNIFNTVTTNMELRSPEFAMLRAVGMTEKEFERMIFLEGLFYGGGALLAGIPLGILISWGFHQALAQEIVVDFRLPWLGILGAAGAVAVLLFGIMHYSMKRIDRQNIVETIRNENI
ncbi:MAG: ABC transporter permease [Acetatifactor sp.]|nr:ABC transporter permease [Acetatifactor sp.]